MRMEVAGQIGEQQLGAVKTQSRILDRAHLAHYTMGSPALEREIIGLFTAHLPILVESLATAQSADEWRFATHTLKGSAQAVGATKITGFAQKLENIGDFQKSNARKKLLDSLKRAVEEFTHLAGLLYP